MPLSERARVEVYIPDLPQRAYQVLLEEFEEEFPYTFGGCTINRNLRGSYYSQIGVVVPDRINLIYMDTRFRLGDNLALLSVYTDRIRRAAFRALNEEAILVTVALIYHAE